MQVTVGNQLRIENPSEQLLTWCKKQLIPRLDRLYLTTPQKDYAVITQSIGRIARTFEGKGEPIAYDYVDDGIQYLVRSYKKRCTTYRKAGCKFIDGEN